MSFILTVRVESVYEVDNCIVIVLLARRLSKASELYS